jgi:FkbH-like protein
MELAEVAEAHPGIKCMHFRPDDPAAVLALVHECRDLFGKSYVNEEDRLRLQSLRAASEERIEATAPDRASDFIAQLDAELTIVHSAPSDDRRAIDLVNKTNQFNLNGRRFTDGEWQAYLRQPGAFLVTSSYKDRFGPLGKIAVLLGRRCNSRVIVDSWVMSCRAFSRQIEYRMLECLFRHCEVPMIELMFSVTDRNEPMRRFLDKIGNHAAGQEARLLSLTAFNEACPALKSRVVEMSHA